MNNTISTLSLSAYDILAVLAPGIILTYPFFPWLQAPQGADTSQDWITIFLFILVAYITGLLWKGLMDFFFNSWLRNNPQQISNAHKKVKNKFGNLVQSNAIQEYYKSYYYLQKRGLLGNILILEKQVALIRNLLFVFPLSFLIVLIQFNISILTIAYGLIWLIMFTLDCNECKTLIKSNESIKQSDIIRMGLLILLTFIIAFTCTIFFKKDNSSPMWIFSYHFGLSCFLPSVYWIKHIQNKIYELVWEGYYFHSRDTENYITHVKF